jgi:amidase
MGDGEVSGWGAEVCGEVTVRVDIVKHFPAPMPFLVADGMYITIASSKELGDAANLAVENMLKFLLNCGMVKDKASMLMSLAGDLRICQIVDPLMTARMEFPMEILEKYGLRVNI